MIHSADAPIIIDHTATKLSQLPPQAILNAKASLHIAYGHTSHGSQLVTGMTGLVGFRNSGTLYAWQNGALDLRDQPFSGASDLGNPNRTAWESATRTYLGANPDVNVVIWSWCGQVSSSTSSDINTYLTLMNGLESDFPNVKFVYMTGHLDGSGIAGNLHQRNEQIRAYCRANNKILYDFADIETYDPDGVYYGDKYPTDACNYDYNNSGSTTQSGDPAIPINGDRNWALDWQESHTQGVDWYTCSAVHSRAVNANQKAYAAWWLWARLAGWEGTTTPPVTLDPPSNVSAQAVSATQINLSWNAPAGSITGYMIFRDGNLVNTRTQTNYNDTGLMPSTHYTYTVRAFDAQGTQSQPSSPAEAETLPGGINPMEGLSSHWKLDESNGNVASDSSGNGNAGTLLGGVAWTTGQLGGALAFDGVNDSMDAGTGDFGLSSGVSLSLWVRPESGGGSNQILIQRGQYYFPFMLRIANGRLNACIRTSAATNYLTSQSSLVNGAWNLVTMTYGNGAFIIYLNGVENARSAVTGNLNVTANQRTFLGTNTTGGNPFRGAMDDIRIYNRALSASEASALFGYQPPAVTVQPPSNLVAQAVSTTSIHLTWNASTSQVSGYRIYRNNALIGTSTQIEFSDLGLQPSTPYTYTVRAFDAQGNESVACSPATATTLSQPGGNPIEGLCAHWKMDETSGTAIMDASGKGHNGSINGQPTWIFGRIGGALHMDGIDDSADMGVYDFGLTTEMSISLWVRPDAMTAGSNQVLMQRGQYVYPYVLRLENSRVRIGIRTSNGTYYLASRTTLSAGSWSHIILTYRNGELLLYLNGILESSSAPSGVLTVSSNQRTFLGMNPAGGSLLNGALDDVRIYSRVLSPAEIQDLMNTQP